MVAGGGAVITTADSGSFVPRAGPRRGARPEAPVFLRHSPPRLSFSGRSRCALEGGAGAQIARRRVITVCIVCARGFTIRGRVADRPAAQVLHSGNIFALEGVMAQSLLVLPGF